MSDNTNSAALDERALYESWATARCYHITDDGFEIWQARAAIDKGARQAAPEAPATTASASTELILPPLPAPSARLYEQNGYRRASVLPGPGDALYTAEQVRQAQRDAYELGYAIGRGDAVRDYIDGRTAGTAPEGWKLVPVEPTIAMIAALGWEGDEMLAIGHGLISQGIADQYKAALAAAPSIATKETP